MTTGIKGMHHLHKRKRIFEKLEKYPNPNKLIRFFDKAMLVIAIIIPLMTIPQILKVWVNKSAGDVSLITWSAYVFSATSWLIYSIIHKDKPLIINSILWIVLEVILIIGVLIYS